MSKSREYDNESISTLKGADRVRKRPSVIFGSDDLSGTEQSFFEILSNSIDEAREGFGNQITITRYADHSIKVEDNGRGIPVDYNQREKRFNWELVYCELYAGGKYRTNEGFHYEYSLGLNGLGACATQYASEFFDVVSLRDGYRYELHFEKGVNIGGLSKTETNSRRTGTSQHWKPDREVFTEIEIPSENFHTILKRQAIVNAGVRFIFIDKVTDETTEFHYPEGILGFVQELDGGRGISEPFFFEGEGSGKDRADKPEYKVLAQCAFVFNNEAGDIEFFHNSSWLEHGGSPERAMRSALVAELDHLLKRENKYKANESKISFTDIEDSLIWISSSFSTLTSYENQTKKSISNKFIQEYMTELIRTQMEIWFIEHKAETLRILDQVLINKRSRENAEKTRLDVKKKLMGNLDFQNRIKNFVDCRTKDVNKRELYIVEGNSALGSVKMARDAEFQAVIPIRGKILNCLKADYKTIFNSEIITDLIKVLGCGVEIKSKHSSKIASFDLDSLRWNKIIICTDADVDGFQIRTLILTMFYRLMPTLITEGKIFIAESPLFEITHVVKKVERTLFAYSDREKNDILKELNGGNVHIQRSKGLGENEPEMMWLTTMNPETRKLIEIVPVGYEESAEMFDLLLGDNLAGRKQYIQDYGDSYMDMLDLA
ncbi:MAG TPA: DNA topoisomerase [Clostridiaceae bacterium]|nr:DNA topoisomerase [Clostridiaceae bacterium]